MKKLEIRKEDLIYNLNSIKKIVNDNTKIIPVDEFVNNMDKTI